MDNRDANIRAGLKSILLPYRCHYRCTEVLFSPITSIFLLLNIHFHNYSSVL